MEDSVLLCDMMGASSGERREGGRGRREEDEG